MTKDEALKLALEALKQIDEAMPFPVAKLAQKVIKEALAQPEHDKTDVRCECCGYMTYHREHLGCIRAAKLKEPEQEPLTDEDRELLERALRFYEGCPDGQYDELMVELIRDRLAQPEQESVMILPDGSAFGVMSFRLPDDHWIYAPNEYRDGEYEPIDLPKPILTHQLRDAVVAAVRYAVRGATMRGQETDFDPDALVQNAVYALCGPYTTPPQRTWVGLTDEDDIDWEDGGNLKDLVKAIEAKLKQKNT